MSERAQGGNPRREGGDGGEAGWSCSGKDEVSILMPLNSLVWSALDPQRLSSKILLTAVRLSSTRVHIEVKVALGDKERYGL